MYQNITFLDFTDTFRGHDRQDQFTYEGKRALYDYLCELEDYTGTPIELDVIALCCDFTEYDNFEDLQKDYGNISSIEHLRDHTQVLEVEGGGLIIQQF